MSAAIATLNNLTAPFDFKTIQLTQYAFALVDEVDYEWLSQWAWCVNNTGYAVRGEHRDGKNHLVLMHREILIRMGADLPDDCYGDHISKNRLDNRRCNLRPATPQESSYNTRKVNKHGYRGVTYAPYCFKGTKQYERKTPWQARIRIKGRKQQLSLGYYATAEEAAHAYDEGAKKYHGEFATLNFPKEVQYE